MNEWIGETQDRSGRQGDRAASSPPPAAAPLVPVCARCRRIRQDGRWIPSPAGWSPRRDPEVTHGLCPSCLRVLYPEVAEEVLQELGLRAGVEPEVAAGA